MLVGLVASSAVAAPSTPPPGGNGLPPGGARPAKAAAAPATPPGGAARAPRAVPPNATGFALVGGQEDAVKELSDFVRLQKHPDIVAKSGVPSPPRGVLLYGPPGTGKTLLATTVAESLGVRAFVIKGAEFESKYFGESTERLNAIFDEAMTEARKNKTAIVFLDEIDTIGGKRDRMADEDTKVSAALLTKMEQASKAGVLVVAATNRPDALDGALRSRFGREIPMSMPSEHGREQILSILTRRMPLSGVDLRAVASKTDGFSGRDLESLVGDAGRRAQLRAVDLREAAQERAAAEAPAPKTPKVTGTVVEAFAKEHGYYRADDESWVASRSMHYRNPAYTVVRGARRPSEMRFSYPPETVDERHAPPPQTISDRAMRGHLVAAIGRGEEAKREAEAARAGSKEPEVDVTVTKHDFDGALDVVKPSTVRENAVKTEPVHWDDVVGLEDVKAHLQDAVRALRDPEGAAKYGTQAPRGILLYGPPGTGKTQLAKAVATEAKMNFLSVNAADVMSMWQGESAKNLQDVFRRAHDAKPAIVFVDELDALAPDRGSFGPGAGHDRMQVVNTFLTQLDGLAKTSGVIVIGATNRPNAIDGAVRRSGRFDHLLYVGLPDAKARASAFEMATASMQELAPSLAASRAKLAATLAAKTEGYTAADIKVLCQKAGRAAWREGGKITMKHFEAAIAESPPSVSPEERARYEALRADVERR